MESFTKAHLDDWLQEAKQITHAMTSDVVIQQIRQGYSLTAGQEVYLYISTCWESGIQFPLWDNVFLWVYHRIIE